MDIWGKVYKDHWKGIDKQHFFERDDGRIDSFSSAGYFKAPRSDEEQELLDSLSGPVLDLGCGVGSYTLYLQKRGLSVIAGDSSEGAVEVSQARGCKDARLLDITNLDLPEALFQSIVIMGNTIGIHQTAETFPLFLAKLRNSVSDDGVLLCTTIDPLMTDDPSHLEYHRINREKGVSPGQTKMRIKYDDLEGDWVDLLLPTISELDVAAFQGGWKLLQRYLKGPLRIDLYKTVDAR